ncbi:NUMOD3 domain-containing DNA-binding protein [Paraburkholderia sediminicola]|uniref:NUMOD3 domain-containing DNA-binding protein n=1 Tax=Paraburkholderia sediminicola TaxID=458836 RepID=UPI0038B70E9E
MAKVTGIYKITNTQTGKVYVGSALSIERRIDKHMKDLKAGTHHSSKLQRSYAKWGMAAFVHEVLEVVAVPADLLVREQRWIDTLDACRGGYNMRPRAESNLGHKFTPESRARLSAALKGIKRTPEQVAALRLRMQGKPFPAEALAKARLANSKRVITPEERQRRADRARNISDETRAKRSASMKGKTWSPESRAKLSASLKACGWKPSAEHIAKLRAIHTGCKRSDAFKQNLRDKFKGRPCHANARRGVSLANRVRVWSEVSRQRLAESQKARWSDDLRQAQSEKMRSFRHTDESKAKIAASNSRRVYSEETLRKMSESQKGRKQSPEVVARRTATRLANLAAKKAAQTVLPGKNYSLGL